MPNEFAAICHGIAIGIDWANVEPCRETATILADMAAHIKWRRAIVRGGGVRLSYTKIGAKSHFKMWKCFEVAVIETVVVHQLGKLQIQKHTAI